MSKLITLDNLEKYNVNIQKVIDNKVPTKVSAFENDSNYVSLDAAQQMIDNALPSLEYCTNNDILRLFDASIPEEPETPVNPEPDEPDTPEEPETPVDPNQIIGRAYSNGDILVTDTNLDDGEYVLQYIDNDGNIIDNFNPIMSFEVDNTEDEDIPSMGLSNVYPEDIVKKTYAKINPYTCINCGKCYDTTIGCKYNNIIMLDNRIVPTVGLLNEYSSLGAPGCFYTICNNECIAACPYYAIGLLSLN